MSRVRKAKQQFNDLLNTTKDLEQLLESKEKETKELKMREEGMGKNEKKKQCLSTKSKVFDKYFYIIIKDH